MLQRPRDAAPDPSRNARDGDRDGAKSKFAERRAELAQAALVTLAERGYSRTSLREIAENSSFSHGVLHYYFKDKVDLIACSVRLYKARCVTRYDRAIAECASYAAMRGTFLDLFAASMRDEAHLHRLWYDLRSQALYDAAFRADVIEIDASLETMIWRVLTRFAELSDRPAPMSRALAYATFDGLFQQCLIKHLSGDDRACDDMIRHAASVLDAAFALPSESLRPHGF